MVMSHSNTLQASGRIKLRNQIYQCFYNFGAKCFSGTDTDHILNILKNIDKFNGP